MGGHEEIPDHVVATNQKPKPDGFEVVLQGNKRMMLHTHLGLRFVV